MKYNKTAVRTVKREIWFLSITVVLMVLLLLLMTVRSLYAVLDTLPYGAMAAMLVTTASLTLLGLYLIRSSSKKVIASIEQYSSMLNSVLVATKRLHEIIYSDVLVENILDVSMSITQAGGGSVLLADGDSLVFKIVKGPEGAKLAGVSIPNNRGIAGWAVQNGTAIRVEDAQNDKRFNPDVDGLTGSRTESVMCVPLKSVSGVIGAIELINKKSGPFTEEDEEVVAYLAEQTAVSFDRATFYEDKKNYEIHLTNTLLNINDKILQGKRGHPKRVARLTLLMANAMGMPEEFKTRLYRASLLHDIGFLEISPMEALSFENCKKHVDIGYNMLKPINFYADIAELVLHHHERLDGKGYPSGLSGEAIPMECRMILIADAFDAMVNKASYKTTGKVTEEGVYHDLVDYTLAVHELGKHAGRQFDEKLVKVFIDNLTEDYISD